MDGLLSSKSLDCEAAMLGSSVTVGAPVEGVGDVSVERSLPPDLLPWAKAITLPDGMFSPQLNKVAARSLALRKAGKIILPDKSTRSCGWFVVGAPGNLKDLDQMQAQEMVVDGGVTESGDEVKTRIEPGDIIAASDFQCWPVDLVEDMGDADRWRVVQATDVIMVVKQGSELHKRMLRQYIPFKTERDLDMNL